jgi:hypothetical protein
MIRLLLQHENGKITEEQLAQILALPAQEYTGNEAQLAGQAAEDLALFLKHLSETLVSRETIVRLIHIV